MAEMTGFDPAQAEQQLNDFNAYGNIVVMNAYRAAHELFLNLRDNWCSPKAVEFGETYAPKIESIRENLHIMYRQIYRSGVDAYNIIARAHGDIAELAQEDLQPDEATSYTEGVITWTLKEASSGGVVGMNVANTELALRVFLDEMKSVVNNVENTPTDIAFYDPDGSQKAAYRSEITKMINSINEIVASVNEALSNAMETETNTIMLAKDSAAGTMAG